MSTVAPEGVHLAENLAFLRRVPDASIDLIYIDPPFGTGQHRRLRAVRNGAVVSDRQYRDDMPLEEYLEFLEVRLREMHRTLRPAGSLYLHLDFHTVHHARLLLDEVFGPERFLNEIVWAYDYGGRATDRWPRKHDNILWYAKSDRWTFNRDDIDRLPYMAPGLVGPEKAARGKLPTDTWWMTIVPTNSRERTGYPTQKPLGLLERIVRASSRPGELVADFFGGSGTTGVAAQRLGRRCLLTDNHPEAVRIARQRLAAARLSSSSCR